MKHKLTRELRLAEQQRQALRARRALLSAAIAAQDQHIDALSEELSWYARFALLRDNPDTRDNCDSTHAVFAAAA